MKRAHNIYIHVPFCMSKCNYCAFYSFACSNPNWNEYADSVCQELRFWSEKLDKIDVPTIFFGGGTPSLMPVEIFAKIMNCIYQSFNVAKDCEITLESNPGTLGKTKLTDFVAEGVNRLSVGIQSLKDEELKFLGRRHDTKTAVELLETAKSIGLNVNGDFIYGLPSQSVKDVEDLCQQINQFNLNHVSMYELTIEKNTPFGKMNLNMPNNETMAQMYNVIPEILSLPRYEVSNYAKSGFECRHNMNVWAGEPYIGIGRGAAGRIYINGEWFEEKGNNEIFEKISPTTRTFEKILTGLRTIRGVKLDEEVNQVLNFDWIQKHKNLIEIDKGYLHTTTKGLLVLDGLMLDLII